MFVLKLSVKIINQNHLRKEGLTKTYLVKSSKNIFLWNPIYNTKLYFSILIYINLQYFTLKFGWVK